MKSFIQKLLIGGAIGFLAASSALATVTYTFDFSNLTGVEGGSGDPFQIVLTYNDYVTTTGLFPLAGAPHATTLGYSVSYAGTNPLGFWVFDDDGAGELSDTLYLYNGSSFLTGINFTGDYITAPGVYQSWGVMGNAPNIFFGSSVLTVTDDRTLVPEPASVLMFALGLLGLAFIRRKAA